MNAIILLGLLLFLVLKKVCTFVVDNAEIKTRNRAELRFQREAAHILRLVITSKKGSQEVRKRNETRDFY